MKYSVYEGFNIQPNEEYNVKEILKKISRDHYRDLGEFDRQNIKQDEDIKVNILDNLNSIVPLIEKMDSYIFEKIVQRQQQVVFITMNAAVDFNLTNKELKVLLDDLLYDVKRITTSNVRFTGEELKEVLEMIDDIYRSLNSLYDNKVIKLYQNFQFPYQEVRKDLEDNINLISDSKDLITRLSRERNLVGGKLYKIGYKLPSEYV